MRITITGKLVNSRVKESSAATLTAKVWDDSTDTWAAQTPTNAYYRIDNPTLNTEILGWTSLTAAASMPIVITGTQNAIVDDTRREERRQVTVKCNSGLSTQYQETADYWIVNLAGQT